eukprot:3303451-Rhodomonas_salina.1
MFARTSGFVAARFDGFVPRQQMHKAGSGITREIRASASQAEPKGAKSRRIDTAGAQTRGKTTQHGTSRSEVTFRSWKRTHRHPSAPSRPLARVQLTVVGMWVSSERGSGSESERGNGSDDFVRLGLRPGSG